MGFLHVFKNSYNDIDLPILSEDGSPQATRRYAFCNLQLFMNYVYGFMYR